MKLRMARTTRIGRVTQKPKRPIKAAAPGRNLKVRTGRIKVR